MFENVSVSPIQFMVEGVSCFILLPYLTKPLLSATATFGS